MMCVGVACKEAGGRDRHARARSQTLTNKQACHASSGSSHLNTSCSVPHATARICLSSTRILGRPRCRNRNWPEGWMSFSLCFVTCRRVREGRALGSIVVFR